MKLRNILITAAAVGMMLASADRTGVVGYTAGDYTDMNTYAHKVAGENVAWTAGDNFNAVWSADGTTWGFQGGDNQDLVNMWWSNGTYGLNIGLEMTEDQYAADGTTVTTAAETNFDIGFGMELFGMDFGFGMNTGSSDMSLNLRRACSFWAFDTFSFGYNSYGDVEGGWMPTDDAATASDTPAYSVIDLSMYGTHEWGPATGMFGLGLSMDDRTATYDAGSLSTADACGNGDANVNQATCEAAGYTWEAGDAAVAAATTTGLDAATTIDTNFSVESTLTDWCDLRVGYSKSFNLSDNAVSDNYGVGLGFSFGSVGLDMTLTDGVLGNMMSNPLHYMNGRNDEGLTTSWTLTYNW